MAPLVPVSAHTCPEFPLKDAYGCGGSQVGSQVVEIGCVVVSLSLETSLLLSEMDFGRGARNAAQQYPS